MCLAGRYRQFGLAGRYRQFGLAGRYRQFGLAGRYRQFGLAGRLPGKENHETKSMWRGEGGIRGERYSGTHKTVEKKYDC